MDSLGSRNIYDLLAEPQTLEFWNVEQVVFWMVSRDFDVVSQLANGHAENEENLLWLLTKPRVRHILPDDLDAPSGSDRRGDLKRLRKRIAPFLEACREQLRHAYSEIRVHAQADRLVFNGRKPGADDWTEIKSIDWTRLELVFCDHPAQVCAVEGPRHNRRIRFQDLSIRRELALTVFPANDDAAEHKSAIVADPAPPADQGRCAKLSNSGASDTVDCNNTARRGRPKDPVWEKSGADSAIDKFLKENWPLEYGQKAKLRRKVRKLMEMVGTELSDKAVEAHVANKIREYEEKSS